EGPLLAPGQGAGVPLAVDPGGGGPGRGGGRARTAAPGLAAAAGAEQAAALLRAGVAPVTAWAVLDAAPRSGEAGDGQDVRVVRVVRRLVAATGAPAAEALDACAAGLRADAAARAAVRTALAGARVSARTVSALPLLGLGLGALLGARPWAVLASSGPGRACVVAGVVLLLAGHRWSSRLVRRAEAAGR
ncbi:hypothetical protein, partial [Kineococcus mangrovi]|uniref:hypothetical protein n=1 Tax=Kineococcus mangrovi TaxID=1660183 RepID=UPI003D7D8338